MIVVAGPASRGSSWLGSRGSGVEEGWRDARCDVLAGPGLRADADAAGRSRLNGTGPRSQTIRRARVGLAGPRAAGTAGIARTQGGPPVERPRGPDSRRGTAPQDRRRLLTQPTRVRLDFDHAPLTQVTRSLSQQAGFKVALYPDNLSKWAYTRVTLHQPEPVTFWKAVDLVCESAELQQSPGLHGIAGPREPTFALTNGPTRSVTPNFDHGPFRVSLLGVHYQRDLNYGAGGMGGGGFGPNPRFRPAGAPMRRAGPYPVSNEQFTASLMLAAEPRLNISQNGQLQVTEAVDELGQSLVPPPSETPAANRFAGYFGPTASSVLQFQAQLHRPAKPGHTIKRLRGSVPLTVCSRRPDPLIVPLDQATGKKFGNSDVDVVVHSVRPGGLGSQMMLELSVKANERAERRRAGRRRRLRRAVSRRYPSPSARGHRRARPARPVVPLGARLRDLAADAYPHRPGR